MLFSLVLAVCCGLFLPERLAKIRKSEAFCVRTHAKADTIAKMRDAADWEFSMSFCCHSSLLRSIGIHFGKCCHPEGF